MVQPSQLHHALGHDPETARLIGFARVGKDVAAVIQAAIKAQLGARIELDHLERVKLKPG